MTADGRKMMANESQYRQLSPPTLASCRSKILSGACEAKGAVSKRVFESRSNVWMVILLLSVLAIGADVPPVGASLGGGGASITSDAQKLGAVTASGSTAALQSAASGPQSAVQTYVLRTSTGNKYTYSEFTTAANLRVREFAAPDGKVFGLAWKGPRPPDLDVLLGSYFGGWRDSLANQSHISLHRGSVHTSSLVVEMGGPMGLVVGRAWAPALVPAGVDARNVVQ
jgi:hypothetical protein